MFGARGGDLITALQAARYLLALDEPDEGDATSNLKLQKLLYYAQGFSLALHNEPLFEEDIEAWQRGPVVHSVYRTFMQFGVGPIETPGEFDLKGLPEKACEVLNETHTVYGQFSAWRLREMTHEEPPWADAYKEGVANVISHEDLRRYFKTRLIDQ